MNELLSTVIPLSLGAAFSPTVLAFTVLILGGKKTPRARIAYMILGMSILLAMITFAAGYLSEVSKDKGVQHFVEGLDIALGMFLLYLGTRSLLRKPSKEESKSSLHRYSKGNISPIGFIPVGFLVMLTDVTSLVLFIPAIRDTTLASITTLEKVFVCMIPYTAVLVPAFVPLLLTIISPKKAMRTMTALDVWLKQHSRATSVFVSFIFGVFLLWRGISSILGSSL